jgi:uncharacterized membrane protein YhaH (DUF805 family)
MNFPTSVKSGFSNYANFKGRASRSEFWWFVLFSQLIQTVAQQVSGSTATIAWFALLIPGLSVHVRRLHDSGRSLRWFLWLAASMAGAALAFVGLFMQSAQTIANLDAEQLFDNGSQFWIFVMFISLISLVIGSVVNFVFLLMPSDEEMNKYGPPPPPPTI